jgi:tetratricopeptide (TPR) repeat protein
MIAVANSAQGAGCCVPYHPYPPCTPSGLPPGATFCCGNPCSVGPAERVAPRPKLPIPNDSRNKAEVGKAAAQVVPAELVPAITSVYGITTSADATSSEPKDVCGSGGEKSIAACTQVINDREYVANFRYALMVIRGAEYGAMGRYDLAIRDFDQVLMDVSPDQPVTLNLRGQTYGMMGDYNRAIDDFTQAIKYQSDYAAAYYNRGQTYAAKGDYDLAIKDFSAAIHINDKYALAFHMRGNAYLNKKDYAHALADFTTAITLSPDDAAAYDSRGTAYVHQRDFVHALSDYSKAIALQPNAPDFYLSRAMLAALQSDLSFAVADLNEAISLNPQRADFYLLRGNAWFGVGNAARAEQDLDKAIALDPKNQASAAAMAFSLKGQIKYLKGELAAATQSYDEAVRLDPKWPPFYMSRGTVWEARGEYNRAIRDYTQAAALQPDAKSARSARGLAYFGQGDFALAAEDFAELKNDANDLHGVLWYHLAKERAGSPDSRQEFAQIVGHLRPDSWPTPIFQMFLGQRAPDSVLAAANDGQQRCEAQFYGGEWQLMHGARGAAAQAFHAAATDCALTSDERRLAIEESRQFGSKYESR